MVKKHLYAGKWFFISLFLTWFSRVQAQSYSQLIYDNEYSAQMGAGNLITLHHALYNFTDKHIRDTFVAENTFLKKSAGVGYRLAKLFLLEHPIDQFISLAQHEVFGHGFRYREFEYENVFYNLKIGYPYGKGGGYSGSWGARIPPTTQERNTLNIGGVEGNRLLADNITYQILLDDEIHYRQGSLFYIAQNNLLRYLWSSRNGSRSLNGSNDMSNYINIVNTQYASGKADGYNLTVLSNQSLISLINPMQLYAVYSMLYTYGIKGEKSLKRIPMIQFKNITYLPALNYSLTPFGSQYHFVNYVKYKTSLVSADFMHGDNMFNTFYGVSLKGFNLLNTQRVSLNLHIDIWNQPELELEKYSTLKKPNVTGEAVKLDIQFRPYVRPNKLGLFVQAGYKSKGFVMGEMLKETYILRCGVSMHL